MGCPPITLSREQVARMFPNASASLLAANSVTAAPEPPAEILSASVAPKKATGIRRRGKMNRTEEEFSRFLESRRERGEIREWEFEAIKLHLGEGAYYTLDFLVRENDGGATLVEIKGAKIWSRDAVRYKAAVGKYSWLYRFELWQRADGTWRRL